MPDSVHHDQIVDPDLGSHRCLDFTCTDARLCCLSLEQMCTHVFNTAIQALSSTNEIQFLCKDMIDSML